MKLLKKIPFFLLLLPVFFCLHGVVENYGYLTAAAVFKTGVFILAGVMLLFGLVFLFYRMLMPAALIVFFISFWYLFFGAWHDVIKNTNWLSFLKSYTVLLPVIFAATIAWILFVSRKIKWWPQITLYLNMLLLVYCLVDFSSLLTKTAKQAYKPPVVSLAIDSIQAKPNLYLLVMDEYAGYASLVDSFGFKNTLFYNFLESKGFEILPVVANYNNTVFSMSSILNMQYVHKQRHIQGIGQFDYLDRLEEINNPAVVSAFKKMGYSIYNYSIFDVDNIPSSNTNNNNGIISLHRKLLTDKIMHNRAGREIGWNLAKKLNWLSFFKTDSLPTDIENNEAAINKTRLLAKAEKKKPVFCYTHVMMPHWQYYFDSAGKPNPLNLVLSKASITNKKLYLGYLQYTNSVMSGLINDIVKADSAAVIVLMSDHGFRSYNSTSLFQPLHFNNICAVRMNAGSSSSTISSNINLFPFILNKVFNQNISFLQDSSIAIADK